MAQVALLIGVKGDNRTLLESGDPRSIRSLFKTAESGNGFESWEVYESTVGRSRRRFWKLTEAVDPVDGEEDVNDSEEAPKRRGRPPKV